MRIALALTLLVAIAGCATAPMKDCVTVISAAAPPAAPINAPAMEAAVAAIKPYAIGQDREPLSKVDDLVKDALNSPEASRALAGQLAALLGSDATLDAKQYACRKLVLVGSAENVPAIAPLLLDEKTADMARYALEPMQGTEADQALLDALGKAPDAAKVGILNSLGMRRTAAARGEIEKLTQSPNPAIADAAKAALGRIGS